MKNKRLEVMTFMSWDNEEYNNNQFFGTIRAIALCDRHGEFYQAINCMRDGSMGEKDENGVYERIWYGDAIENGDHDNLYPATREEVELYLKYVDIEGAAGNFTGSGVRVVSIEEGTYLTNVIVEYQMPSVWRRIKSWAKRLFRGEDLPF